ANNTADKFNVSIHRNIVNWEAVDSIGPKTDILVSAKAGDSSTEWFNHLTISEDAVVPGSLASYFVKTELKERSLSAVGDPTVIAMERDLSMPVLPVRFVPYKWHKSDQQWRPDITDVEPFNTNTGIELQYDLALLGVKRAKDEH